MAGKPKVLVIAHGHPDFDYGGGEVAAYNLFKALKAERDPGSVQFLARVSQAPSGVIRPRRDDEYLWQHESRNHFLFLCSDRSSLERLAEFLGFARPDVIFINHYVHIGLDVLMTIKRTLPRCRIVLTLHEMLAICNHNGQMVKTAGGGLCHESSLDDCARCFPGRAREDFWLRKRFIQRYFDYVDTFVTPSWFLRNRYLDWGLSADRIQVIENVHPAREALPPRPSADGRRNRFGYFGQINRYKGFDVLLTGLQQLSAEERGRIQLEVNGANLDKQPAEFQARIKELLEPLLKDGSVVMAGAYAHHELVHRLKAIDWVVMPSVWWENSPMIIQEALGFGRPVICPAVGGMREKVEAGITGLHVPLSTPYYWAEVLRSAAADGDGWQRLYGNLGGYGSKLAQQTVREHLALL